MPSWAGAISIDLLPGVLILILSGVQASIRREEGHDLDENHVTVGELNRALRLYGTLPPALAQHIDQSKNSEKRPQATEKEPIPEPVVAQTKVSASDAEEIEQSGVTKLTSLKSRKGDASARDGSKG